jgi:hypothetical protein
MAKAVREVRRRQHEQVDRSLQLQVLKSIVQDQRRGLLNRSDGGAPGTGAIGGNDDGNAGDLSREHVRFVTGLLHRNERPSAVGDEDHVCRALERP